MTTPRGGPAFRRSRTMLTGRRFDQDIPNNEKRACATCSITYYVPVDAPNHCPLCYALAQVEKYKTINQKLGNELAMVGQQHDALAAQVNNLDGMKQGLKLMSTADLAWIKSVCYMHRSEPNSVVLTAQQSVHGWAFYLRGKNKRVPEEYVMTSIGGSSLAMAYAYTSKQTDNTKALELLMRAMAWHLANVEAARGG